MKRLLLAISLTVALAGCTQKAESPEPTPSSSEPAASAAPPVAPVAPAEAQPQQSPAAAQTPAPEPPPAALLDAQPLAGNWESGKNYQLILPNQPTSVDAGQVEVIEFLWLGCQHCYNLNPYVEAWKKKLPAFVQFRQEHVTWDAQRLPHARLFYTIRALGGGNDIVVKAFDEIHRKRNPLMAGSDAATLQLQQTFAAANGLDAAAYKREYNGFAVNTSIKRTDDLIRRYRIDQVPIFIINGKYRTDIDAAGGARPLMQLLTDLIASEKAR
jgi:thiol:disulfide interchange protein DsbA